MYFPVYFTAVQHYVQPECILLQILKLYMCEQEYFFMSTVKQVADQANTVYAYVFWETQHTDQMSEYWLKAISAITLCQLLN